MNWFSFILALIGWSSIIALQVVLMKIAHFFEENSQQRTYHRFYYLFILCSLIGVGRYSWRILINSPWPDFLGDPLANLALASAGLGLMVLSADLYKKMIGDTS